MKKIKLIDSTLIPYDYLCHHIVPDSPSWSRSEENPDVVVGIAGDGIRQLDSYSNVIKCAYIIEPEIINGEDYKNVINNQDKYDYIFLHDLTKKDRIDEKKFVYVFHGGTHLRNSDIQIHNKTKLVSMIFSNKQWNGYHSFRHVVYPLIQDKVDGYGTGCGRYIQFKSEGLNDYCFSVAMENYDSLGLFTEKILDCFLSGTIPIFYGTSNIGEYFNEKGFFSFKTQEELISIIDSLSFETYQEMLPYVQENFETAKKYMFPEEFIKNFLNNL
jgi:Glycosyltransferase family 10 (fucosyltransferase) C-term